MTEKTTKSGSFRVLDSLSENFGVPRGNSEIAGRLRAAIKAAGGNKRVAQISNVPLSTINGYLQGKGMKFDAAAALAEAIDVRMEWLATGEGPMRPGDPAKTPSEPQKSAENVLFGSIDIEALAEAISMAQRVVPGGRLPSDPRRLAQLLGALYTEVKENTA